MQWLETNGDSPVETLDSLMARNLNSLKTQKNKLLHSFDLKLSNGKLELQPSNFSAESNLETFNGELLGRCESLGSISISLTRASS